MGTAELAVLSREGKAVMEVILIETVILTITHDPVTYKPYKCVECCYHGNVQKRRYKKKQKENERR